jgi:hypothetical protein
MWPNRTICDVLEEMRKAVSTLNFSYMSGLIEEAQSLANRMEAGLGDKNDVANYTLERRKLKAEIKQLRAEKERLQLDIEEMQLNKPQ